ncbi:MAG: PD40 domain-containing protein [Flavobacteriaceae bacterium]|nr:PD40 domain-containing protein [Flavobacteriaceae bacterium]
MKKLITLFAIAMLSSLSLIAQNKDTKKADKHYSRFEFIEAAEDYNKLIEKNKADHYVYKQLAECYYNIYNTEEAEKWYAKALETSETPETIFKYVQMLKANGKYEKSNEWMAKFAKMRPSDVRAIAFKENPDYLPKILEKGKKFNVQALDINTASSDFGGILKDGKLYITSARNGSRKTYGWNEQPYLDIYEFDVAEDGAYTNETLLCKKINTKYHEGVMSFSPDGKVAYFSRESFYDDLFVKDSLRNKVSVLNLYSTEKLCDDEWSDVTPLPFNSENYSVKNPSVSADGKTLYFASDMPGGFGKFDIYKAEIFSDGTLGEAVNLGQQVNTEGQEMFPFSSSNGTIYFSSDGHLGLGGLDVFHTKMIDGKMAPVRNVGVPVNSNADDFAFNINEDTGEGFISSNRQGGSGSDDIYAIKKIQPLCDVLVATNVTDAKTGSTINGASVGLYDANGNLIANKITDADGLAEFVVECDTDTEVKVIMDGYESKNVAVKGSNEEDINVDVALDPIEVIIEKEEIILNPIYFDFDKSNITAKAAFELDNLVQIMKKYPELVIRAESHTDSRGPAQYNEGLSERRVKSTVQYVISKGIDASRITGEGKGESVLKVDCGSNCSEEDHQMNRRSEFHIVSGNPNSK